MSEEQAVPQTGTTILERFKALQAARKGVPMSDEEFFEKHEATDEEYGIGMVLPGQGE